LAKNFTIIAHELSHFLFYDYFQNYLKILKKQLTTQEGIGKAKSGRNRTEKAREASFLWSWEDCVID